MKIGENNGAFKQNRTHFQPHNLIMYSKIVRIEYYVNSYVFQYSYALFRNI